MSHIVRQPTKVPTRKVLAVIWVFLGAVALLVGLIALRAFVLPGEPALDALIDAVGTAIPLLAAAIVAAYRTHEWADTRGAATPPAAPPPGA